MCYRACSNEQFVRQHMKNKMIFFNKWLFIGCLDAHLAKSLLSRDIVLSSWTLLYTQVYQWVIWLVRTQDFTLFFTLKMMLGTLLFQTTIIFNLILGSILLNFVFVHNEASVALLLYMTVCC